MATFKAILQIPHDLLIYSNDLFHVENISTVGNLADYEIDGNVLKSEINPDDYLVTEISKIQWNTSDGKAYSTDTLQHKFFDSGTKQVYLTIWSEPFITNDGRIFYFKTTGYIDVIIQSKFLKLLYDYNPSWAYTQNKATQDFYIAAAKFFERIYKDTKSLYSLWDANEINPIYFEYLALTLGHDSSYARKVGYTTGSFDEYDIFDRIKRNLASSTEINNFRRFLIFSSELFRKKGTPTNISEFLSFFSIDGKAVELWTQNWGQTPVGLIEEPFLNFDLEDNKHGFVWNNIRVVGNNNDYGMVKKTLNSIILDTYHQVQKLEYEADVVSTVSASGSMNGWYEFETIYKPVYVVDVRKNDGNLLISEATYQQEPFAYSLDENTPVRYDPAKLGVIQVAPGILDYGEKIAISYALYEEKTISSLIANKDRSVKDFDANITWRFKPVEDPNTLEGFRYPENEVFFVFRGIKNSDDLYSNINEYYRFSVNCAGSFVSVSRVVKNPADNTAITQMVNLGSKDTPAYNKSILVNGEKFVFDDNKYYEFRLTAVGSLISAYVRYNDIETNISNNVQNDVGGSIYGSKSCQEWTTLFENISLDANSAQVMSVDEDGNDVASVKYVEITTGGNYGVGCKNGILELMDVDVDILDADTTLYSTTDKEVNLKPKYIEWVANETMRFNNDINNHEYFTYQITPSFDPAVQKYTIEGGGTSSLDFLYMNGIKVTEDIASRYAIEFDPNWISRFKTSADVEKKIIVPFGSQKKWFMADMKVTDKDNFKNYFGGTDTETTPATGGASVEIPGLFIYNESVALDSYDTEPGDAFSALTRTSDTSLEFSLNKRIQQYLLSDNPLPIRGVFQEVCPMSAVFTSLTGPVILKYNTLWENPVFSPTIYQGGTGNTRVVGVRFKNCDDITRLLDVNSNGGTSPVQMWGQYELEVSKNYFKYRPDKTPLVEGDNDSYIVSIFVPIGVLDAARRTYSLPTTYLHSADNNGIYNITLLGVYVRNPSAQYNKDNFTVTLGSIFANPYENAKLELLCNYYFSTSIKLSGTVSNHSGTTNIYVLDKNTRTLLNGVAERCRVDSACASGAALYNYDDDFAWWLPSEVWMKRDFATMPVDFSNDLLSNINHNADSTIEKYFYNIKLSEGSKPAALIFTLTDGEISLDTTYYAKVNVALEYSGFNASDTFVYTQMDNALTEAEGSNIKTLEVPTPIVDYKQSPVKTCYTFYIPISWYPSSEAKLDTNLEWANFISGSISDASITFTPFGLMTYLINQAGDPNNVSFNAANELVIATKGWTIEDWNRLFIQNMVVEFIAEQVPSSMYKLFNKYVTLDIAVNTGANIDIQSNIADEDSMDWEVLDTSSIFVKSNASSVFPLPPSVELLRNWVTGVKSVTLNNYLLDSSFYTLTSNTTLVINTNSSNIAFTGAELRGKFFYDIFFSGNTQNIKEDNFNPNMDRLNWLPFESTSDNIFASSLRKPSEDLVFNSDSLTYNIINFKGKNSFQSINSNTSLFLDYNKTGQATKDNNEITFSKSEQPNINKLYILDDNNSVLDFTTEVIFDEAMGKNKNFNGKVFQHVAKAYTIFDPIRNKIVLGGYYFIGVGVYGFDIGIGIAKYNIETGVMDRSFLAGFGDYDTKNVKLGVWYTLRTIVTSDYIRVIFNEKLDPERLVLNYSINPLIQTDPNRYLTGEFEELVYVLTGLNNLNITYPDTLGSKTNTEFASNSFNEALVKNYRATGTMTGMLFNNELTYVGNVKYVSTIQGTSVFGDTVKTTDLSHLLEEIKQLYSISGSVSKISKTNNGNKIILIRNNMFLAAPNTPIKLYATNVDDFIVVNDKVLVKTTISNAANIIICDENLKSFDSVYVKDLTFHLDHIFKYLTFTNRKIKDIWWSEDKIHIDLLDQ